MNIDDRIKYYLGNIDRLEWPSSSDQVDSLEFSITLEDVFNWEPNTKRATCDLIPPNGYTPAQGRLMHRVREICSRIGIKQGRFFAISGDQHTRGNYPCFSPYSSATKRWRPRKINNDAGICLKFHHERWWKPFYKNTQYKPFKDKTNCSAVWRGATSGFHVGAGNRFKLATDWHNKRPDIDVGFSKATNCARGAPFNQSPYLSDEEFSNFKYIISSPGNINESGLHWKLMSNSVVIMAKPEACTWLMEDKLEDQVHYIQVKDDWSDLGEKIDWCKDNDEKCEEITQNAKSYMNQFSNEEEEQYIEGEVVREYFERSNAFYSSRMFT